MPQLISFLLNKRHGPFVFVIKTTLLGWVMTALFVVIASMTGQTDDAGTINPLLSLKVITALITAPLFENACMIVCIEATRTFVTWHPEKLAVVFIMIVAGAVHVPGGLLFAIHAGLFFGIMAYSYLVWTGLSTIRRYTLTVMQHLLANLPASLVMLSSLR